MVEGVETPHEIDFTIADGQGLQLASSKLDEAFDLLALHPLLREAEAMLDWIDGDDATGRGLFAFSQA